MDWILKNIQAVLIFTGGVVFTVIVTRYKNALKKGTNYVIDGLLSLARIHFIILKRYKKSIIRAYRETKVGYRNLRLDLERNYISLKVHSFVHPRQKEADEEIKSEKLDVLDAIKDHKHLIILGHPGAGKTTLMQWLLLKYAYGHMKGKLDEKLIPIFITLRSLESGQSIDELLPEILKQHHFKNGESFIRKRMEKGKCLLIFDGMDEILDDKTRKKFINDICGTYANLYEKSRIIITSRIEEYPVDCFPTSFREREILDLDMDQVHGFVHGILKPEDKPDNLIRQIEKSVGLKIFVTNPLMLSLLTFVYQESYQKLPNDRVKVYERCMQLMLQDRDESKGIYEYRNKFDPDDKELLLCKLAYDFSLQNKWRFTEKELLEHWKKNIPSNLKESDLKKLLKEVCKANGILKHLSDKELSFLHRTFQEYYTAREICKRGQAFFEKSEDSDIYARFSKKEWHEITLFLVGMMDDAGHLIQHISNLSPRFTLQCLAYAKRTADETVDEVIKRAIRTLEEEHIHDVGSNLIYIVHRYSLERVIKYLATALEEIKVEKTKKDLWQVIDHVMAAFSPQKQMVYVSSGIVQWGKASDKWIPGFWMDIYPVTNEDYHAWVDAFGIKELPRHWKAKSIEEPTVLNIMKPLHLVDISFKDVAAYSATCRKDIPNIFQWRKAIKNEYWRREPLNDDKKKRLKRNKLEKLYNIYLHTRKYAIDLARVYDVSRSRKVACELARDTVCDVPRDLAYSLVRDLAPHLTHNLPLPLGFARANTCELARDVEIDLKSAFNRTRDLASDLSRDVPCDVPRDLACALARDLAFALDLTRVPARELEFEKLNNQFDLAHDAAKIIAEELKKSRIWTKKAWEQLFELGKILVDTLVIFLEMVEKPVPDDLLKALRQPGLLTPVTEFPPNSLGIYDLVGNVWEWTSTTNEYGEHLVCGGAWTEERFGRNEEMWAPPTWRDFDLGFRCVCDWDKITEVKEPGELKEASMEQGAGSGEENG